MIPSERICSNRLLFALFKPDKAVRLGRAIGHDASLRVLDVGCGNHSVRYLKTQFPKCRYTGIDRTLYHNTAADLALMDEFRPMDLESADLSMFPDRGFDLVVLAHVLEHLHHGREVLLAALPKVAPGGIVYVAHPHADSVGFPHRKDTLNFYDDPTHVAVWRPGEAVAVLGSHGFEILDAGRTRLARNLLLLPVKVTFSRYVGGVTGPMLWDLYGFEEYVLARRPSEVPSS
jgi:2-polyprenyl-3-methyl-5-hydroxy-6-metoxy-1,4-benzoquinol methylase